MQKKAMHKEIGRQENKDSIVTGHRGGGDVSDKSRR
jgi:hypothetical protein